MKLLKEALFATAILLGSISTTQAITVTDTATDFCNLGAAGSGAVCRNDSLTMNLSTPTAANGDGILTLTLLGDYSDTLEFVNVNIEGTNFGNIFDNNQGNDEFDLDPDFGNDNGPAITVTAMINNVLLNTFLADGLFSIDFTFSNGGNPAQEDTVNNLRDGTADAEFITASLDFDEVSTAPVPVPAAVWLFGSALLGLIGMKKKKA